jgi:hypothetical protein
VTYEYSRFLTGDADLEAPVRPVVAGKRALTDRLPVQRRASDGRAATFRPAAAEARATSSAAPAAYADPFALHLPVQLRGDADELSAEQVHAAAAQGVATPASPLPFFEQIQASFGPRHDLSSISAHLGSTATASAHAMGASAFATGRDVVFAGAPDLHTAAHEAAHVIQQAHGVTLYGGVGAVGDRYEAHADAVADRVVAGQSAADLLDAFTGGAAATSAPAGGVQQRSLAEGLRAALAAPAAEAAAAHAAPVQRALIDRLRGIVQTSGTTVDYNAIIAMIHAASTAERQAVLADTQLRSDITARLGGERAATVFSSLMEGSHTWENPPHNDFYNYFVARNGSGTLPNTATMNCWESILYACYLAGQVSASWIRSFYSTAMGSPDPDVSIWSQLGFSLSLPTYAPPATSGTGGATAVPGSSTTATVTPRAGQLLFYHTSGAIPGHVAVSLGGDQAISLWSQPNNVHSVQRIQVNALPGTVYVGDPPW